MWKAAQTDLDHLVSNFTTTLEKGTTEMGIDGLNNLITRLREIVTSGI